MTSLRGPMPLGLFRGVRTFTLQSFGPDVTRFTMEEVYSWPLAPPIVKAIPGQRVVRAVRGRAEDRRRRGRRDGVKRGLHIEALDALGDANRRAIVEILSGRERGGDESSRRER